MSNKEYAKGVVPSMKRRLDGHDYSDRQMYLITLVVEGRRSMLGDVQGVEGIPEDCPDCARFVPS